MAQGALSFLPDVPPEGLALAPPPLARSALAFALRLGRSLHEHGTPSHRLEDALVALCTSLGLKGHFFSTPTALFVSIEREGLAPEVHLLRVQNRGVDLGRLVALADVSAKVTRGELTCAEGLERIEEVERCAPRYRRRVLVAMYALNSAAACCLFGGGWREALVALVIGLSTGLLSYVSPRGGGPWRAFEPTAAFCAAVIGTLAASVVGPMASHLSILAGLIALIPGYGLTVSIAELANRQLASGSARLTGVATTFLGLGFGVALGNRVASGVLGTVTMAEAVPLPLYSWILTVPLAVVSFAILFKARQRDIAWILVASVAGIFGARLGAAWLGPELGSFLGAFCAAAVSNLYSRALQRPAVVPLFPALMLLVPGSIGFRSFASLMAQDVVSGVQTGFQMVLVAVALVAGLLVANDVVPSKRAL